MIGHLPEAVILAILAFASNPVVRVVRFSQGNVTIDLGRLAPFLVTDTIDLGIHAVTHGRTGERRGRVTLDLGFLMTRQREAWFEVWKSPGFDMQLVDKNGFEVSDLLMREMRVNLRSLFTESIVPMCNRSYRSYIVLYWTLAVRGFGYNQELLYSRFFKWVTFFHYVLQSLEGSHAAYLTGNMALLSLTIIFMATKQESQSNHLMLDGCCDLYPEFMRADGRFLFDYDRSVIRKQICKIEMDILSVTSWTLPRMDAFDVMSAIFERIDIMTMHTKSCKLKLAKQYAVRFMWNLAFSGKAPGWGTVQRAVHEGIASRMPRLATVEGLLSVAMQTDDEFLFIRI